MKPMSNVQSIVKKSLSISLSELCDEESNRSRPIWVTVYDRSADKSVGGLLSAITQLSIRGAFASPASRDARLSSIWRGAAQVGKLFEAASLNLMYEILRRERGNAAVSETAAYLQGLSYDPNIPMGVWAMIQSSVGELGSMSNQDGFIPDDSQDDNPWNDFSSEAILEALDLMESRYAPSRLLALKPARTDSFIEFSCMKIGQFNLLSRASVLMKEGIVLPVQINKFLGSHMNSMAVANHSLLIKAASGLYSYDVDGISDEIWYQVSSVADGMEYLRELTTLNREFRRIVEDAEMLRQAASVDAMLSEAGNLGSSEAVVLKGKQSTKKAAVDDFLFDGEQVDVVLLAEPEAPLDLKAELAKLQNWSEAKDSFVSEDALDYATSSATMDDGSYEVDFDALFDEDDEI